MREITDVKVLDDLIEWTNQVEESVRAGGLKPTRTGRDVEIWFFNVGLYLGETPRPHGRTESSDRMLLRFEEHKRRVYGDRYGELSEHLPKDPRVAELLVDIAVAEGSPVRLPDELIGAYEERVGGAL